jgi:RNA-binding protein NOB1
LAETIYTTREVVAEIKDSATKQRFEVVPYEIQFRQPYPEYIQLGMDYGMDYRINDGNL